MKKCACLTNNDLAKIRENMVKALSSAEDAGSYEEKDTEKAIRSLNKSQEHKNAVYDILQKTRCGITRKAYNR